jgi:hypothetical protein
MSVNNFIPALWAGKMQLENARTSVIRAIANTSYEGLIANQGDQIIFPGIVDPTITTYAGSVTFEDIVDSSVTMNIDQAKYFAVKIDDVDKVQANQDILAGATQRAGELLKRTADQYAFGLYAQAGSTVTDATCDTTTILSDISSAARKLDEQDTPMEGRWMVIAPWVKEKLELAGVKFSIREGTPVASGVMWANFLGFDLYVSNNVTDPTASATSTKCLAGGRDAFVYADQLTKVEAMRLEGSFDDGIRGLHVYGAKVLRPNDLVQLVLTYAAETAI